MSAEATALVGSLRPSPPIEVLQTIASVHFEWRRLSEKERRSFARFIDIETDEGIRRITVKSKKLWPWSFVPVSRVIAKSHDIVHVDGSDEDAIAGYIWKPGSLMLVFDVA